MNILWLIAMLLLLAGGEYYVSLRTWQLLPALPWLRIAAVSLMSVAFLSFFVAMSGVLDRMPIGPATFFYEVGTSWLMILVYLIMLFVVLDLARISHLIPPDRLRANGITAAVLTICLVGLFVYANRHYEDKQRVELTLDGGLRVKRPVKLVMVSDLHLGYHNRRADLRRWLERLKAEKPDAILIAGDLIDRTLKPVLEEHSAEEFRRLGIPVYAALGNHDYYTGVNADIDFCRAAGIRVLRDSVAYVGDLAIVGRDDRTNAHRLPLRHLLEGVDRSKYIINLDHQPYHLEEAEQSGVDFQFSGHTHHGQVWPFNWITDLIYEDAFGPLVKRHTHYYVSSGLGIWGAKFRIGTQSEYVVVNIRPSVE